MTQGWVARSIGSIVLVCAGGGAPSPAIACICVNEPVTVVLAKGRVFTLDGPSGPESIPDATVELETMRDHAKVSATTTDGDGLFELATPPPGEYLLRVSLVGFQSTAIPVRIKKGPSRAAARLVVRLDIPTDCTCGDACLAKSEQSGTVAPQCLVERHKVSFMRVRPPNDELQRTRLAQAMEPCR